MVAYVFERHMETLAEFTRSDQSPVAHIDATDSMESTEFFAKAQRVLEGLSGEVISEIIPHLEKYAARATWHPTGFMVFPLGANPEYGTLRLHIWPKEGRHIIGATGNTIHDHAWHLASKILTGTYYDELYDIQPASLQPISEEERVQQGLLRVFGVRYAPGEPDVLEADETYVRATKTEDRAAHAGEMHTIASGIYHKTTIPDGALVATLVLDSPAVGKPHVLVDTNAGVIAAKRESVAVEDVLRVKQQFFTT